MIAVQTVTSTFNKHGFTSIKSRRVYNPWSGKYENKDSTGDFRCRKINDNTIRVDFNWSPFSYQSFNLKKATLIKVLTDKGFIVKDFSPSSYVFYVYGK